MISHETTWKCWIGFCDLQTIAYASHGTIARLRRSGGVRIEPVVTKLKASKLSIESATSGPTMLRFLLQITQVTW